MSDKRTKNGWAFYDWANSVYSLVISTAVFPLYFSSVTQTESGKILFYGQQVESSALYSFSLTLAFVIVAILSPSLSGIADYVGKKKRFMQFFCYLGSASCMGLYFFEGTENLTYGLAMSVLASVGFWGSLVFYNAFLPEVAKPEEQDRLSAKGFSLGYIGATLLLILNLAMIQMPETFGLTGAGQASRISFLLVGLWWAGFAQITFRRLPDNPFHRKPSARYIIHGFKEIRGVIRQLAELKALRRYLYSFFCFSVGVQTVVYLASLFGSEELGLEAGKLILTILIIQLLGIAGAYLFSWVSKKYGNLQSLKVSIVIWGAVCFAAYGLSADDPQVEYKFYAIAAFVGLVMGGIQAISRSTYSKLLPETHSHASFFSFYDVAEKVAIVSGTAVYGILIQLTGSMRMSALALAIFFVLGFLLITRVPKTKYVY